MRAWAQIAAACVFGLAVAVVVRAASEPPAPVALTGAQRCEAESLTLRATVLALRAELAKAQARVAELEAPLVDQAVAKERAELEAKWREALKLPPGAAFDWRALTFTAAPGAGKP